MVPSVTFSMFDVEDGFDFVRLFDGMSVDGEPIAELHGQQLPNPQSGLSSDMLVQLETDDSVAGEGFLAEFTCIVPGSLPPPPPGACISPGLSFTAGARDVVDIDRSGGYGHNHDCRWTLSCSDQSLVPLVTFELFDLEAGFDFVALYDGVPNFDDDGNADMEFANCIALTAVGRECVVQLHGQDVPLPREGTTNAMLLQLTSDDSVAGDGFLAHFSCVGSGSTPPPPPDACTTGLTYTDEGTIDKSDGYDSRHDCRWLLVCSDSRLVPRVSFESFDLEAGFDFVRLFDGDNPGDVAPIAELHGSQIPFPIEGRGAHVLLQLTTDASLQGEGFLANFDCVRSGSTPPPPPDPCTTGIRIVDPSVDTGDISKSGGYTSNHDCRWVVECSDPEKRPLVTFASFDLEEGFDFVRIFEGSEPTETPIAELHGQDIPSPVESTNSVLLLQLESDDSVNGDGFHAAVTCVAAGSTPPPPPDACTTGLLLQDIGVVDRTGGYSGRHDCRWLLDCTDKTKVPMVTFTQFDLEEGFDFVRLFDGMSPEDPVMSELHGTTVPFPEEGSSPDVLLQLETDASVEGDGFRAEFHCVSPGTAPPPPPDACVAPLTLLDSSDRLTKNGGYGHSHDCQWILSCSESSHIVLLQFTSFDLEQDFDFVNLFDGPTISDSPLGTLSGRVVPPPQRSSGQSMTVQLTSDGSVAGDGFVGNFRCVPSGTTSPPGSSCTEIQLGVYAQCISNCERCQGSRLETMNTVWAGCVGNGLRSLGMGVSASEGAAAACANPGSNPTPAPPCSQLQLGLYGQCMDDCATCRGDRLSQRVTIWADCVGDGTPMRDGQPTLGNGMPATTACQQPPSVFDSVPSVESVSVGGHLGMTTYQLSVTLPQSASNLYALAGLQEHPFTLPADCHQVDAPFGVNTGGVNPAFIPVMPDAAYDSWLTIGITDGDQGGKISSIGLNWDAWNDGHAVTNTDGAVFFMDPSLGPSNDGPITVAQLTVPTGRRGSMSCWMQGRMQTGPDFNAAIAFEW
jgi:hypothetical protein